MKSIGKSIWAVMMRNCTDVITMAVYLAVVVFPLLSILFFGSLFREGVPSDMPIAVVDLTDSHFRKIVRILISRNSARWR
jgi:hypothetical protein